MQPKQPQEDDTRARALSGYMANADVDALMRATARRAAGFFAASLVFALTLGASLGAWLWLALTLQLQLIPSMAASRARVAHGYAQLFGFAALFVCGVAYHVLPRLSGRPWQTPTLQHVALVGLVVGAGVGAVGALAAEAAWTMYVAHVMLLVGAAAFALSVTTQFRAARPDPWLLAAYLQTGCWWLVLAAGLPLLFPGLLAEGRYAVWEATLWGFTTNWIYGMSLRILPASLGLRRRDGKGAVVVYAMHQLGVLLWCLSLAAESGAIPLGASLFGRFGGLLLAAAGYGFVYHIGFLRTREAAAHRMPGTEKFLWAGYAWLAIALVCGPLAVAWTGSSFVGPTADFARHALTLGFLAQMIFGVSMRVLPAAAGIPIWSDRLRDSTYWLLNLAVVLRAGEAMTAWGGSIAWYRWSSLSGPLAWAAFVAFAVNLLMSVRQLRARANAGA
ncbi:MAG: NnrS family protein [candidate division KSB1 bacterium]|nr:NnrS family protein [candidate division KSB1 bacterium]